MTVAVLLGALCGAGLVLVHRAINPWTVSLPTALERLGREGLAVTDAAGDGATPPRVPSGLGRWAARATSASVAADLAVLDRSTARFGWDKLSTSVALCAIPAVLGAALQLGGVGVPTGVLLGASATGAVVGFVLPDMILQSQARRRRLTFLHALSSYLDLVTVLLAGGSGIESSLAAAAEAGDGWAFDRIRESLTRARALRTSPWASFAELGARLGVTELTELAASVQLAGEQGARVRLSLQAKASALRSRQMAQIEADAQSATERMGIPTVLMFVGFLVLIGYPAVQMIVGGF